MPPARGAPPADGDEVPMVSAQRWLAHEVAKVDSDPIEARTFISTTYNSARMSLTTSSDEIAISPPERVSKTIGSSMVNL